MDRCHRRDKTANIAWGFIRQKGFIVKHTIMNKITGALLFLLPYKRDTVSEKKSEPDFPLLRDTK